MAYNLKILAFFAPVISAAIVLVFRYVHIWNRRRSVANQYGCQQPTILPSNDPFFGLDAIWKTIWSIQYNRRNATLQEQHEKCGPTFQTKFYQSRKICSIEPQNVQSVFGTNFKSWGVQPLRLFAFEPLLGKGIMGTDGAQWEHSRALLKPVFARDQISNLPLFEVHVARLLAQIPTDGSMVDLRPLFSRMALDASSEMLFGQSLQTLLENDQRDPQHVEFLTSLNYGQRTLGKRMQLPHYNIFTRDPLFWKSCNMVSRFVQRRVEQALLQKHSSERNPAKYTLLHELVKETNDADRIRQELLNIFLPAHEASGVALTNIFFHLARHPRVWQKLKTEVGTLDRKRPFTFETLKSLKYLQQTITETLRLNPSIGTTTRIALCDTVLPVGGGVDGDHPILVHKGDVFSLSFYALQRRRDIYGDDAAEFRPERWDGLRPGHWAYLPFSGGPRVCIGQQLALTQVAYTLARFLQTFSSLENRDPVYEFVELYTLSTQSKNGAKVAFAA